ncbi:peptidoglycan editing factor PgeF [Ramlibacter rhizophilus]|uniref:Purine nucleoside phosphorylase n=1 Tax=Ramlibacter rhizophilus TaxID=1781167 RepID=A0A4Z0BWP6_9BURK|nr:peptidoglycan editing factor PgeF [Ramlibacter rhizophilus]TFZ03331.1 peptidoglycan editing factor PgeF [Ramlibacter rhizophilus]
MDLLRPDWPAPASVRAACSTRKGGVSAPPYDSLNLGDHVGDDPSAVAANRARYAAALGARPVFLRQVHGSTALRLDAGTPDGVEADACVSTTRGLACTIMVADCLPVLLCDDEGRAVAAAHAGWRGLLGAQGRGVLEAAVGALARELGQPLERAAPGLHAWLGPCIGPQAFEVGPEVREAFVAGDAGADACFTPRPAGKWLADLPGLARRRLRACGIESLHGNDGSPGWCTVTQASRFFSHRRDRVSGRFAASVWLA